MDPSWQPVMSDAQRRKQRRRRSWWRHEQQSIAAALATYSHHSAPRGQKTARAGEEDNEMHFTATFRANPPPQAAGTENFSLDVEDVPAAGSWPDRLFAVSGPQERVLRHTVEQMGDCVPVVPSLDVPVPQMVDQAAEIVKFFVSLPVVAEQVRTPVMLLQSWPCKPWGGGKHELCLSSSTPPGQGGIQILAAATVAEAVVDVSVTTQLRSSRFSSSTWRCLRNGWCSSCFTETDSPGAVLGSVGTCPLLCNDRLGWSRQSSLEMPRFWKRLVAMKVFFAHFATFFALLRLSRS